MTPETDNTREHDVVVYGATGFVGKLTALYLAGAAPEGTRIALAGRSQAKLERVRSELPANAAEWPLIVADSADAEAVAAMAASAHARSRPPSAPTTATACRWSRPAPTPAPTTPT